jgi:hypothetical protein
MNLIGLVSSITLIVVVGVVVDSPPAFFFPWTTVLIMIGVAVVDTFIAVLPPTIVLQQRPISDCVKGITFY